MSDSRDAAVGHERPVAVLHERLVADFDVEMQMRDGVTLRADVYRPDTADPVPAIILRTPYDKAVRAPAQKYLGPITACRHGYAYVAQDARGRYRSDGDWTVIAPDTEIKDGFDTVEWVAAQPWCDGSVGMIGVSYESFNQFAAAIAHPPALKAIAPNSSGFGGRGLLALGFIVGWSAWMAKDWLERASLSPEDRARYTAIVAEALAHPERASRHLPIDDLPLGTVPVTGDPVNGAIRNTNAGLSVGAMPFELCEVPALMTNGYFDPGAPGVIHQYRALRDRGASPASREHARMILGPWAHGYMDGALGELNFGMHADQKTGMVPAMHLQFFDRHLKGDDTVPELPRVTYFVMGLNEWKTAEEWPPPGTETTTLFLGSMGVLCDVAPGDGEAPDVYHYDPKDPTPSFGGRILHYAGSPEGPLDQRRVEARPDVAVYSTPPLPAAVEIAGNPAVHLFASSSVPQTDFFVRLCDVDADGVSINIADGVCRTAWRDDADTPSPDLVEGETVELYIDLGPVANHFEAGHCVRLTVASAAFPDFDANMNTGHPIGVDAAGVVAVQSVHHDAGSPSRLLLPVTPLAGG